MSRYTITWRDRWFGVRDQLGRYRTVARPADRWWCPRVSYTRLLGRPTWVLTWTQRKTEHGARWYVASPTLAGALYRHIVGQCRRGGARRA